MMRAGRAVLLLVVPLLSAGWVWPLYCAVRGYFSGVEEWLFQIATQNGGAFKISRFIGADIELAIALGWLALVVVGWTAVATWRLTKKYGAQDQDGR